MVINFRRALPADYPELAELISVDQAWRRYGIDYAKACELIESAEDEFILVAEERRIVGFAAWRANGVGNIGAYLRMIVVAAGCRSRGIGSSLLGYIWELARQKVPNLFLICSADNLRAQRFYQRAGFRQLDVLPGLVVTGHDEILYWKTAGPLM